MSPGKQTSPGEATAPMAAGARLEAIRRRARDSRVAVWTVIAAGPIALAVADASTPTTVAAAPAAKPTAMRTASAANPGGYAQLFVSAWLRSSADNPTTAQARLAQSMAPDVELPNPAADAQPAPQSVTTVRNAQQGTVAWSVTVAAQYANGSVRYYTVPVAADASGSSFAVTGAPGAVGRLRHFGPGRPGPGRAGPKCRSAEVPKCRSRPTA
ncbi:hypothetical protein [Streptomyces sp. NPDC004680]|uniref:hypothetical protein n=1 Tax=Streptomyces sp. NPDC004680 TaxID=3154287 RepID=UPI0033A3E95A